MKKTDFAGLTQLAPGEPLTTDGSSFQARNPLLIDHYLRLGAQTHRHNAAEPLPDPTAAPTAAASPQAGGLLPAGRTTYVTYTLLDDQGGETRAAPGIAVTTRNPLAAPDVPPSAAVDYTAGSLRADTYYYAVTLTDGQGGETLAGPSIPVEREPGYANGRITLSGLAAMVSAAGAAGWRLYRARAGGSLNFLATGTDDTFIDNGSVVSDVATTPPTTNRTNAANRIAVSVPAAIATDPAVAGFNVYLSPDGSFQSPCLAGSYLPSAAGAPLIYLSLVLADGAPPDVATTIRGASKIDPDTELLDWHWKRPVESQSSLPAGEIGDIRIALDTLRIYVVRGPAAATGPAGWSELIEGEILLVREGDNGTPVSTSDLEFVAGGATNVTVTEQDGRTVVTITSTDDGSTGGLSTVSDGQTTVTAPSGIQFTAAEDGAVTVSQDGQTAVVTISGAQGPQGDPGPPGIGVNRGTFAIDATYAANDLVEYNGSTYLAPATIFPGTVPPAAPWVLIAAKGDTGAAGLPTRTQAAGATGDLAPGGQLALELPMAPAYRVMRVATNYAARVRLYASTTHRNADMSRAIGTIPQGDHGLMLEVITDANTPLLLAPDVGGFTYPAIVGVPATITNLDPATQDITFTITYLPSESL